MKTVNEITIKARVTISGSIAEIEEYCEILKSLLAACRPLDNEQEFSDAIENTIWENSENDNEATVEVTGIDVVVFEVE